MSETPVGRYAHPAKLVAAPKRRLFTPSTSSTKNVSSPFSSAILRRHYEQAATDKSAAEKFYKLLADYKDRDALVLEIGRAHV